MFANIRRHQKWLWVLISAAVIISFVWYFNPNQQGGGGGGAFNSTVGTINGRPLSRNEYMEARTEAELNFFMRNGTWFGSDEFSRQNSDGMDAETKNRLILKEKIRENNIHVTENEVADWIFEAFGRERPFTPADYDRFIKETLGSKGIRERDFERYVRGEVGIMHLFALGGMPGKLVTPQEAEAQYRRQNEQVQAEIVSIVSSNYLSKVTIQTNDLQQLYTNRQAFYRIPDKVRMAYVEFPASNYFAVADQKIASITNLAQRIDEIYLRSGTNFYTDTNGMVMTPEAAKKKIHEDQRKMLALVEAQRAATEFSQTLLDLPEPRSIAHMESLAISNKLSHKITEPFAQYESPAGMDVPDRFGQTAFSLSSADPFIAEPIRGQDAVYVTGLKEKIPGEVPSFEKMRDRVIEDYKIQQSSKLALEAATNLHAKITAATAAGKKFSEAAKEAGVTAEILKPFSPISRTIEGLDPRIDPSAVKSAAFTLKEGEVSEVMRLRDGAFILHVSKKIPVSDVEMAAAMPNFIAGLRRQGQSEAFQEWFSKQAQTTRITIAGEKEEGAGTSAN